MRAGRRTRTSSSAPARSLSAPSTSTTRTRKCGRCTSTWRFDTRMSILRATSPIAPLDCCRASVPSGLSTSSWKRDCRTTLPCVDFTLVGSSGSHAKKHGTVTSSSKCRLVRLNELVLFSRPMYRWAKFEEKQSELGNAREIYEKALEVMEGEQEAHAPLYIAFAEMEERSREYDRARAIYKYALDRISKADAKRLFTKFIQFEKQFGDRDAIEYIIMSKRRFQYEEQLAEDPTNYDVWFDYLRLEESTGEAARIREVYERAIGSANLPPVAEKVYWSRYIFLWINYALFEELAAKDIDRTRQIYQTLLKVIPHDKFSFNKAWTLFAHFEIRQHNLSAARKVLGHAIGMAPSDKIFDFYIDLEVQLGNIDRCRELFQRWLQWRPDNCKAWVKFSELEAELQEPERVRGVLEIAVNQPALDMPELVWKTYIDYEVELGEPARARALYKRLLDRTKHVKVWISFAQFETEAGRIPAARAVFKEAFAFLKPVETTEERVILIEAWRDFEEEYGSEADQDEIRKNMPARVKKRRKIETGDGSDAGYEEFYDYVFPDMKQMRAGMKLLQAARKWKEVSGQ
eukprot:TRINITY_DN1840_c0_g1_i1.p1 TRINITY_DN1840_c0_g1~~TRINITY_DN1840_c0_g1_i1.p1  ORF type:complete len:575 (-),score=90.13 TRINITY_DN1840_c0_g1_i1:74-1798(-)